MEITGQRRIRGLLAVPHPGLQVEPRWARVAPVPGAELELDLPHEEVTPQGVVVPDGQVQDPALELQLLDLVLQSDGKREDAGNSGA